MATLLPQLSISGNCITDPYGNVVILRGYNLCSKTAQTPEQLGFDIRNAAFLKRNGVSVVRLGVPWINVQPYLIEDGNGNLEYDMQFLASIKRTIQLLADFDIYTLVDFHQDAYSAPWGFGAPSWAMVAGGTNTPNYAWPINTFGGDSYFVPNLQNPPTQPSLIETDLNFAFDAFWSNSPASSVINIGLLDAYGAMLKFVSTYLSDQGGNILGYDPINEPEPGSDWIYSYIAPTKTNPNPFNFAYGCEQFDEQKLATFYTNYAIPNLQQGHPGAIIWCEPNIYFDYNAPTFLPNLGAGVGFNFHNYDAFEKPPFQTPVQNALAYQNANTVPLLCSEFGGTTNYESIEAVVAINDQNMLSAIFWAWFNNAQFNFFTVTDTPTDPRLMGVVQLMSGELVSPNLNVEMLNAVSSVYPRSTSGSPISFSTSGNVFTFNYSNLLVNGGIGQDLTSIMVPVNLYPGGFNVAVTNGSVSSQEADIVYIAASTTEVVEVTVTISPA